MYMFVGVFAGVWRWVGVGGWLNDKVAIWWEQSGNMGCGVVFTSVLIFVDDHMCTE